MNTERLSPECLSVRGGAYAAIIAANLWTAVHGGEARAETTHRIRAHCWTSSDLMNKS